MVDKLNDSAAPVRKVIRDKAFAKRLETACERSPHCPTDGYRGRQKWIYDNLESRFGLKVSPEAVRKWFSGESRPRPKIMSQIALLLEVDEAWLSLGITPDETPQEKKKRNAVADGVVNYVAALIQLSGGNIAFPEPGAEQQPDLFAIIKGRQYAFQIKQAHHAKGNELKVHVPTITENQVIIAVVEGDSPMHFDLLRLTSDVIAKQGRGRGGFVELTITQKGSNFTIGEEPVAKVTSLERF